MYEPSWAFPEEAETENKPRISDYIKCDTATGRFLRKHGILLAGLATMVIWTWSVTAIAYHNGVKDTTEKLTAEYEVKIELAKQSVRDEYQAKTFVSGEASKQAAIATDAGYLARVGQGVLNTYEVADLEDAKKVMLCVVCRVLSGGEFANVTNIADAATAEGQWWGYANSYTKDVFDIAKEVASIYENNEPMPCDIGMTYASWNGHDIILRDRWKADYNAKYW